MSIQRATRTSTLALLAALVAVLATACIPTPPATEFTGQLLDADGAVVSGAVVFVADDAGSASARVGRSHFHIDETSGCQTPSEAYLVQTCTDAEGGFTLALPSPAPSSVRLVFERSYWRTVLVVEPLVQGGRVTVTPTLPALEPDDELEAAVRFALPTLEDFELIFLNDEKAILDLIAHAGTPDANVEPIHLLLPIRQPDGTVSSSGPPTTTTNASPACSTAPSTRDLRGRRLPGGRRPQPHLPGRPVARPQEIRTSSSARPRRTSRTRPSSSCRSSASSATSSTPPTTASSSPRPTRPAACRACAACSTCTTTPHRRPPARRRRRELPAAQPDRPRRRHRGRRPPPRRVAPPCRLTADVPVEPLPRGRRQVPAAR
jgi:hypothetical protein